MASLTDKIAHLLALANSPYEAEAKAALLKARQLMAKYKLTLADVTPSGPQQLRKEGIGLTTTKLSTPWVPTLAATISKHYCCKSFLLKQKGAKRSEIGLVGLDEDFQICKSILLYAFECVSARCSAIRRQKGYSAQELRQMCHSYGWGFCMGLKEAFQAQSDQHQEWALVMAVPQAVEDATKRMAQITYARRTDTRWNADCGKLGYQDGKAFDPSRRLNSAS